MQTLQSNHFTHQQKWLIEYKQITNQVNSLPHDNLTWNYNMIDDTALYMLTETMAG